jgi:hypothetical protein
MQCAMRAWRNIRGAAKYLPDFHVDRDHVICIIQNHTIPVVQLTQLQKRCTQTFKGTGVLRSLQSRQVLRYKLAAQAMEVPG